MVVLTIGTRLIALSTHAPESGNLSELVLVYIFPRGILLTHSFSSDSLVVLFAPAHFIQIF